MSIPGRGRWIFGWYLDVWGGIFFVAVCGVETEGAVIFLCVFTVLLGIAVFVSVVGGVAGCVTVAPPSGWTMLSVISCTLLRVVTHCLYSSRVGVW